MAESRPRVMWLLNHSTARKFEVAMLKKLGFTEIFLPKNFPQEVNFRSASIDFSEDAGLSIPAGDLAVLNAADWYKGPDRDTWEIANRHFDLLFFIPWSHPIFRSVARHFQGAAILRGYGVLEEQTYHMLIQLATKGIRILEDLGRRFWLGTAYEHLADAEPPFLRERAVYLPVGLSNCQVVDNWNGTDPTIFFVCPDVAANPYYTEVYREFKREFAGFPYAVGGSQSISSSDPHLLGFVSEEQHEKHMREFRVMFYHSTLTRHIHYTPFEAVRAGMPLVFMGGGLLDRLGGTGLPGRCRNYEEARAKVRRILEGDRRLIDAIRNSQTRLLDAMRPEALEPAWRQGMKRVLSELKIARAGTHPAPSRRKRIAVMLPMAYRGGTLRSAKLLAQALWIGSRQAGEDADVVFGYPEVEGQAHDKWDSDLPPTISRRIINWRELDPPTALRAMRFAGNPDWQHLGKSYLIPDDGVQQMCDCDLWVVVSDRLNAPLLPIRPNLLVVYDYSQRYEAEVAVDDLVFLSAAREADRVLVTTQFTKQDALVYAGVHTERVSVVPMLVQEFPCAQQASLAEEPPYFLWTTNLGRHKNHINAITALLEYYELLDGKLECHVSGVNSESLLTSDLPHLQLLASLASENETLRRRLRILGEMPDALYRSQLSGAQFLWHPARIDNGSFSVVEAALLGVPSLSSKYPAMEEMDTQFGLHLTWMDSRRPAEMAAKLKWMEEGVASVRARLPCRQELALHSVERLAGEYWKVARECL